MAVLDWIMILAYFGVLGGWSRPRRVLLVRRAMEDMKKRRNEPPHREFAQLTIPGLELVTVNDGMYADGRRNSTTVYTAGKEDAASNFAETANFLHKITSASQLRVDQRWQLIIYWAFRKYKLIYRLYPPLLGDQIMLPLA